MVGLNSITGFLKSRTGKGFLVFATLCALLAIVVGYGFYRSSVRWFQVSTGEQKATALRLVDAFYATYATTRADFLAGDAPVPATFRAHAIDLFNKGRGTGDSFQLIMVGPEGREIGTPPGDPLIADAIRRFSEASQLAPETVYVKVGGEMLLRTIYPSVASQQSCVDCHNQMSPGRPRWKLNDVMGAFVLSVRADTYLRRAALESTGIGLFVFLSAGGIGFFFFSSQHRYFARRAEAEEELRNAKIQAEAANISKSQFLATMSHELRTPLNAILGFSELIAEEAMGPIAVARYRDYARDIHGSGQHLLAIINDILDMSKIESGQLILRDDVIDVAAVIETCRRFVQQRADEAGVLLTVEVAPNLPDLCGDELRVKQILLNLLSNAIKFTPRGRRVTVGAERVASGIVLWVADNGIGMTPDEIAVALKAFHQVDNSLQRTHDGTGLGLPLSKNLAELHGASLIIESTPGEGTTVRVTFPEERLLTSRHAARTITDVA